MAKLSFWVLPRCLIYALTETLLGGPVRARLLNRKPDQTRAGDMHPMMMVVLTRVIMPVVLMVGFYIFLRGHNEPGGGFIAGLIVSIGVVMQYMASGFAGPRRVCATLITASLARVF